MSLPELDKDEEEEEEMERLLRRGRLMVSIPKGKGVDVSDKPDKPRRIALIFSELQRAL